MRPAWGATLSAAPRTMTAPPPTTAPPSHTDATSFVAIRYEEVAEIGAGGMGRVALARAHAGPNAGQYVAIKRVFPHLATDAHVLQSFFDELWLTSVLHHPNVVELLDWGRDAEGAFLVMQFVPGDSLRALNRARETAQAPMPLPVVVELLARVAEGLHAAHELVGSSGEPLQLVHRDVSPANVLVGYDGAVKVIDFGVAKARGRLVNTQSGLIKGKYGYMSPEQVRGLPLDRRSDLFSLGIVAWETLTLLRLYNAPTDFDVVRMVTEEAPVPPSEIRGDVPALLDEVVLKLLAKKPEDRYETAQEVARALAPLRPSPEESQKLVAEVARSSMPERLQWIEGVLGRPIALSAPPPRGTMVPGRFVIQRPAPMGLGGPTGSHGALLLGPPAASPAGQAPAAPQPPPPATSTGPKLLPIFAALGALGLLSLLAGAWLGSR